MLISANSTKLLSRTDRLVAKMSRTSRSLVDHQPGLYARADEEYQAYTSQVSLITRTLALTAIAVIWLFASRSQGSGITPFDALRRIESARPLLFSLGFSLGALLMDFLQYSWGSVAWGVYRWSLDQIMVNDSFDVSDLSVRVRLGWAIARAYGLARRFEYGFSRPATERAWGIRRQQLRRRIQSLMAGEGHENLRAVINSPWAPLAINRLVSAFYSLKIVCLLACYILLAIYLFH
jgi:hypothetical protein